MRRVLIGVGCWMVLGACAPLETVPHSQYEVTCRTHARKVTMSGEADQQGPYLECLKLTGRHEVEVTEVP